MIPQTRQRKPRNSSKVNLLISLAFHTVIVVTLLYFAAREGLLGKAIRKIAVEMVKEKPPEKPKEPEKPREETPKPEEPKVVEAPKVEVPRAAAPAPPPAGAAAPPAIAPPSVDVASFDFGGGALVETSSDPVALYQGLIKNALESRWERPEDIADRAFVAEVEVAVDRTGKIVNPVWKKESGDRRWDDSVRQAIARTAGVNRAPPSNFPPRVVIRFDVVELEPLVQP
jgi:hypothetical protein